MEDRRHPERQAPHPNGRRSTDPRIVDARRHPKRFVSLVVAAEYVGCDWRTMNKYLDLNLIGYITHGRRRRVSVESLDAFKKRNYRPGVSDVPRDTESDKS